MSTRYSSPNPSRPKTPDFSNSLRKSKEIPQRSSVLKSSTPNSSSLRSSFEQKENLKSRSPSFYSCSKGSKNFMAPTISAASKVIAASQKKKILQERNEVINPVTDSIEFPNIEESTGVVIDDVGFKSEMGCCSHEVLGSVEVKKRGCRTKKLQNEVINKEESTGVVIDEVGYKSEMGFCSQEVSSSVEVKKGESRTEKLQNVPPLPQISPLDADPSLPPYDPKTNYLSPRPQFLHYRPNPRIEHYLNNEGEFLDVKDWRNLEDSFSLESSEDDVTALTDEKDSEEEESFHPEFEEGSVSENEPQFVAEPEPELEPELEIKPLARRPFKISKFISFLLVLVLACIYAPLSDSPIISSSMLKDHIHTPSLGIFDDLHQRDYLAVATVGLHLNGLASRFKHWSTNSFGYFTSLYSPPKFNLGDMKMGVSDGEWEMEHAEIEMDALKDAMNTNVIGNEMEKEIIRDEGRNELEQEIEVENTKMETGTIVDGENYRDANLVPELEQELSHLSYEVPDMEEEVENTDSVIQSENLEEDVNDASSFGDPSQLDEEFQTSPVLELLKSTNYGTILGLSLTSLLLISTIVFLHKKPKQIPMVKSETQTSKMAYTIAKGVIEDTGSMEVSSLDYIFRKREGDEEKNLSHERRLRRDSAASSTISYGSFTTYERLSVKKGSNEEEVVTPVRRSSRIRKQFTSP